MKNSRGILMTFLVIALLTVTFLILVQTNNHQEDPEVDAVIQQLFND